jgi:hypothetical protein
VRQYVNCLDENFKDIVVKGIKRKDSEIVHLPLELVFAPLEGEYQEAPGAAPQAGKRASRRQALEEQEKRSVVIPLHRALSLGNRIVITGGPGCGKSTVLIYLAWKLAHAWKSGNENEVRALLGLEGALPLREGKIAAVGPSAALQDQYPQEERLDASGRVVLPGFVDAHTHALWAGDRAAEFEMRLEGKTYLEIWPPAGASFRQ